MEGLRNFFGPCPREGDQARPGGTRAVEKGGVQYNYNKNY